MKPLYKGIVLAVLQVALVATLGAKLLHDRATRPRVWARTANYDPDLPIRGRYVSLRVEVTPVGWDVGQSFGNAYDRYQRTAKLEVKDNQLIAVTSDEATGVTVGPIMHYRTAGPPEISSQIYVNEPVAFFIPEHSDNPAHQKSGEELWVEATIPRKGPPRPIRLGVKKNGIITPLNLD